MHKNRVQTSLFTLLAMLGLSGCATSDKASAFLAQSLGERSPVLPSETAAWRPILGLAPTRDSSFVMMPLQWEHGYTKSLTLVWMPLPLQFRYLWFSSVNSESNESVPTVGDHWITSEISLFGSNYSRSRDYNWRPSATLEWKRILSKRVSFESKFLFQGEVKRGSDQPFARTISLQSGVMIQLLNGFSIYPSLYVWNEMGEVRSQYIGEVPASLSGTEAQSVHWRFPLQLNTVFRINSSSEVNFEVRYYRLGYEAEYSELPMFLTYSYYW